MGLIYRESRGRQDLLSKVEGSGPWKRAVGEGRERGGAEKNVLLNKINLKM